MERIRRLPSIQEALFVFFILFFLTLFFFFWPGAGGRGTLCLWDLSFLTRDRTQVLGSESTESEPLDSQGIRLCFPFFIRHIPNLLLSVSVVVTLVQDTVTACWASYFHSRF